MKPRRALRLLIEKIFPSRILKGLIGFFAIFIPPRRSYSQKGEDILVHCFFRRKKKGYYLDIGGFHPNWISNTCLLHKNGWKGTIVDLDQYKLNLFKFTRGSKVKTIRAAVIPIKTTNSEVVVYKFFSRRGWSDVDTLDLKTAESLKKSGRGNYYIEKISSIDINSLLENLPKIDFLNIDIEGIDTDVVMAIDLDRYKIDVILFEDNLNFLGKPKLVERLESKGYFHLFTSGGSKCFALKQDI